jgi:hypothetical protein
MRRSFKLAIAGAIVLAVGTASVAIAAGVSQGLTPGHQTRFQQFAEAGIGDANNNFVQTGLNLGTTSFRQRGGGIVTEDVSTVTAQAFTADGLFAFGCWVVPASMIDYNIQTSVSLHFDSSAPGVSECPGTPLGAAISAAPAMTLDDSSIFGFVGHVALDATWTASGPVDVRQSTTNTTCGSFRAVDNQSTRHFGGGVAITVAAMTVEGTNPSTGETEDVNLSGVAATSAFGDASESTENLVINGPSSGICGQFGG